MTDNFLKKPRGVFWVIAIIALLWNIMGAFQYLGYVFMTDEQLAQLPENQQALTEMPTWATAAFALAVWCGVLGSIALLLRRKWSKPLFVISLLGVIVQMYHWLFMTNSVEVYGSGVYIMPTLVIIVGIFLVWYSRDLDSKGYLR